MSLLSEEIGKRLKAQEIASTAQDLARNQERLMESWRSSRAAIRTSTRS